MLHVEKEQQTNLVTFAIRREILGDKMTMYYMFYYIANLQILHWTTPEFINIFLCVKSECQSGTQDELNLSKIT